jgi:hypothetical protein
MLKGFESWVDSTLLLFGALLLQVLSFLYHILYFHTGVKNMTIPSICILIGLINISPLWRHCLFVAEGLRAPFEAESYAGGSLATGRYNLAGQVKA